MIFNKRKLLFFLSSIILSMIFISIIFFLNNNQFGIQNKLFSNNSNSSDSLKKILLKNKNFEKSFNLEFADTPASRSQGLMNRKELADDFGMLFVFETSEKQYFWMKDTYIPLDIVFFDENKNFVSVQQDTEPCINKGFNCLTYSSSDEAKYVLEVKAGVLPDSMYTQDLTFEMQ